jgi:hypothetical protein
MNTTTVWSIAQLERHTADGIIFTAHYTVDANDGTYSAGAYGSVGLEQPNPNNIIPYANLTPEIVIGWVKDRLNVEEIEDSLQAQLDEKNAPTTATGLPWS